MPIPLQRKTGIRIPSDRNHSDTILLIELFIRRPRSRSSLIVPEAGGLPHLGTDDDAGVPDRQHGDRGDDHGPLEDHEQQFVVGEMPAEAFLELG